MVDSFHIDITYVLNLLVLLQTICQNLSPKPIVADEAPMISLFHASLMMQSLGDFMECVCQFIFDDI